ncbi:hypothetical protein VTO42DRAFT_4913 [Malbranchea cinnamomea]
MSDREKPEEGAADAPSSNEPKPTDVQAESAAEETTSSSASKDKGKGKARDEDSGEKAGLKMSSNAAETLLSLNPALRNELAGMDKEKAAEILRRMDISELLTGLSMNAKNTKDMASYKFWQTQPVVRFDDKGDEEDGPIKEIDLDKVAKQPDPLLDGFEWVTLDLDKEEELQELYLLLRDHYVEDTSAMFRFNYSTSFLNWALKSPGWKKEWHVGVRASKSRKLVASICGVPATINVRGRTLNVTEINFLCIHKKLRSKRLTPVLIKEITRRCYLSGIFQAIYTGGIILPTPVSTCRYYHRAIDWLKLYDVGFSALPTGSTKARQVARNTLPAETSTPGLRQMEHKDVDAVTDLLNRYQGRFMLTQSFTREEVEHLLLQYTHSGQEQVVWAYVVEDPETHQITDVVSFYSIDSSVIHNEKHSNIRAAYLYYYGTEVAFTGTQKALTERLRSLVGDALVLAKQAKFDVFNALTLLDNPLFLEHLKFGPGDGQLHYYLFNYRTKPIPGGINERNLPDDKKMGGVGIVMV